MKANFKKLRQTSVVLAALFGSVGVVQFAWSAMQNPSQFSGFSNTGSISNTRHNLTQGAMHGAMDSVRNNYGEVCVYCHTPHGANNTVAAPLWNRTIKVTNYQTYDELGTSTLTQAVTSTPGSASLTCLSCHDGQTAVDSIINMPGSGKGLLSQQTTQNLAFLNTWDNPPPGTVNNATQHMGLNSTDSTAGVAGYTFTIPGYGTVTIGAVPPGYQTGNGTGSDNVGCLTCHSTTGFAYQVSGGIMNTIDMSTFLLGTDLRNDHPIGITFPIANTVDFKIPAGVKGSSQYFDSTTEGTPGKMDKAEIRTYEGRVECASCHDPHGVPGPGGFFKKTFLRVDNSNGSAVCLTCHTK